MLNGYFLTRLGQRCTMYNVLRHSNIDWTVQLRFTGRKVVLNCHLVLSCVQQYRDWHRYRFSNLTPVQIFLRNCKWKDTMTYGSSFLVGDNYLSDRILKHRGSPVSLGIADTPSRTHDSGRRSDSDRWRKYWYPCILADWSSPVMECLSWCLLLGHVVNHRYWSQNSRKGSQRSGFVEMLNPQMLKNKSNNISWYWRCWLLLAAPCLCPLLIMIAQLSCTRTWCSVWGGGRSAITIAWYRIDQTSSGNCLLCPS